MATIEDQEIELGDLLGERWYGPVVTTASRKAHKEGQIRKAFYANGELEEVTCRAPGGTEIKPEVWPSRTNPFR